MPNTSHQQHSKKRRPNRRHGAGVSETHGAAGTHRGAPDHAEVAQTAFFRSPTVHITQIPLSLQHRFAYRLRDMISEEYQCGADNTANNSKTCPPQADLLALAYCLDIRSGRMMARMTEHSLVLALSPCVKTKARVETHAIVTSTDKEETSTSDGGDEGDNNGSTSSYPSPDTVIAEKWYSFECDPLPILKPRSIHEQFGAEDSSFLRISRRAIHAVSHVLTDEGLWLKLECHPSALIDSRPEREKHERRVYKQQHCDTVYDSCGEDDSSHSSSGDEAEGPRKPVLDLAALETEFVSIELLLLPSTFRRVNELECDIVPLDATQESMPSDCSLSSFAIPAAVNELTENAYLYFLNRWMEAATTRCGTSVASECEPPPRHPGHGAAQSLTPVAASVPSERAQAPSATPVIIAESPAVSETKIPHDEEQKQLQREVPGTTMRQGDIEDWLRSTDSASRSRLAASMSDGGFPPPASTSTGELFSTSQPPPALTPPSASPPPAADVVPGVPSSQIISMSSSRREDDDDGTPQLPMYDAPLLVVGETPEFNATEEEEAIVDVGAPHTAENGTEDEGEMGEEEAEEMVGPQRVTDEDDAPQTETETAYDEPSLLLVGGSETVCDSDGPFNVGQQLLDPVGSRDASVSIRRQSSERLTSPAVGTAQQASPPCSVSVSPPTAGIPLMDSGVALLLEMESFRFPSCSPSPTPLSFPRESPERSAAACEAHKLASLEEAIGEAHKEEHQPTAVHLSTPPTTAKRRRPGGKNQQSQGEHSSRPSRKTQRTAAEDSQLTTEDSEEQLPSAPPKKRQRTAQHKRGKKEKAQPPPSAGSKSAAPGTTASRTIAGTSAVDKDDACSVVSHSSSVFSCTLSRSRRQRERHSQQHWDAIMEVLERDEFVHPSASALPPPRVAVGDDCAISVESEEWGLEDTGTTAESKTPPPPRLPGDDEKKTTPEEQKTSNWPSHNDNEGLSPITTVVKVLSAPPSCSRRPDVISGTTGSGSQKKKKKLGIVEAADTTIGDKQQQKNELTSTVDHGGSVACCLFPTHDAQTPQTHSYSRGQQPAKGILKKAMASTAGTTITAMAGTRATTVVVDERDILCTHNGQPLADPVPVGTWTELNDAVRRWCADDPINAIHSHLTDPLLHQDGSHTAPPAAAVVFVPAHKKELLLNAVDEYFRQHWHHPV